MCYKVSTPEKEALEDYFKNRNRSVFIDDYPYYYHANGFDMPWLPTQSIDTPHTIKPANWKLVPNYIKSVASAKGLGGTLNARNDTLTAGKMWKPYTQNRMLLWIEGFYEPHHPAPKVSQPFYIYMPNKEPFTLGGIYNDWVNPDTGEVIRTFAIITTDSNQLLGRIHNDALRMPLVIQEGDRDRWLSDISKEEMQSIIAPLPDGILQAHAVNGKLINRGSMNKPEVQQPIDFKLQEQSGLF